MVWYGHQQSLEYDFVVAPGADPKQIQVSYEGVQSIGVEASGDLVLRTSLGEVRQQRPRVYQEIAGKQVEVGAQYAIVGRDRVSFELASYDCQRALRIDPVVLAYSTYLSGSGEYNEGRGIAVDAAGSAYVAGYTTSTDFPVQSPFQGALHNPSGTDGANGDAFVTKLSPAGDALVYSTYLGGDDADGCFGIQVDAAGSAYVVGQTYSTDFPTQTPFQAAYGGGLDVFVTKLTPAGNALVYSTYLGGALAEYPGGIAIDAAGSAYVTGSTYSADFPTQSPFQGSLMGETSAFVTKLSPAGSSLIYSTYLGGSKSIAQVGSGGTAIAVDSSGSAYVTGNTNTIDFPTKFPIQPIPRPCANAFVTKFAPAGNALVYSTFLGSSGQDSGFGIAVDAQGYTYVTGVASAANFPTWSAFQKKYAGGANDAFVAKLVPSGRAFVYSTFLGGTGEDYGFAIAADSTGAAYVTGYTSSPDFPTQSPFQGANLSTGTSGFVTKLTDQ